MYARAYYYRNKEKFKEYRLRNKDRIRSCRQDYYQKNKERLKEYSRVYHEKNKEKRLAAAYAYKKLHPEIAQKAHQKARTKRPWERPLANAKNRATKKGFAFDLTREWCERIWQNKCAVSGLLFAFGDRSHYPFAPSIDRIDSSRGYLQDNCRFVLFAINSLKGTGTDTDMLKIASAIVHNFQKAAPDNPYPQKPDELLTDRML